MKIFARHIEFERLIGAAENSQTFSVDEEKHLANCAECAADWRKLHNLFAFAPKHSIVETVPQAATANLLNIYRRTPKTPTKSLAGRLIFDDWKPEFALNERLSFRDARQLLYRAGDFNIDLRLDFADEKCRVSGQVFPEAPNAVVKIHNANFSSETGLNKYGEFDFPPFELKDFNLQIVLENDLIEISDISVS